MTHHSVKTLALACVMLGSISAHADAFAAGRFALPAAHAAAFGDFGAGPSFASYSADLSQYVSFDSGEPASPQAHTFGNGNAFAYGKHKWENHGHQDVQGPVLTPAVPEPSTYALLLAGLLGVAYIARRRSADRRV